MSYIVKMKRTQLYLDEELARLLTAESRRRRTTVSALVRDAVARSYGRRTSEERKAVIDRLAGVWEGRADLGGTQALLRRLRQSSRPSRWAGDRGGKVSPRQRRRH